MNYSDMTYCGCRECMGPDEPEDLVQMREEVMRSPDFIGDLAPNGHEAAAISEAIEAGDDAAIGAVVRSVLSRMLDEHVESYRARSGAGVQQAMEYLHKLYVEDRK
jgi:hypothetical protein